MNIIKVNQKLIFIRRLDKRCLVYSLFYSGQKKAWDKLKLRKDGYI
jgi:hypothetical protein